VLLKELDAARNRNAWYASELELARKAGYVPNASLSPVLDSRATETFDDDDKPLIEALLAMRTELASVQNSVDKQAVLAAKQIAEAEKQRDAAIQEAVYAKAKLAAQLGNASNLSRSDNDDERSGEISRKLATALSTQRDLQSQLDRSKSEIEAERKARKLSDDTAAATQRRMTELEAYKQQNSLELERLKADLHVAQREAREQSIQAAEAMAASQMLRLEKNSLQSKYEEASGGSMENSKTFDSLREAIAASSETKSLLERKLEEEKTLREKVETKLAKLKAEHETRTAELVAATQRLRDSEALAEQHANEARLHRQAVMSGLEKLSTRDVGKAGKEDADRIVALQGQLNSANAMVRKYQQQADNASERLRGAEERIAGLEAYQEQASREGVTIRRQLQGALKDTQTLQAANTDLKNQLESHQLEANAMAVQHSTLKNILSERGISPTTAARARATSPRVSSPEQARLRDLEQQLSAAVAAHEETKSVSAMQAQESESAYREKLAQLENDYQSAVHYVKGTEKMLKQLKEQLSIYKSENSKLKDQVVDLEDKVTESQSTKAANMAAASADWETQRGALQTKVESLEAELQASSVKLEKALQSVRQELADARRDRDNATKATEETQRMLSSNKKDLEQLHEENAQLERRAQDAEQKVALLLDQVETSVDNYRRRSRQVGSLSDIATVTNGMGHTRQESSEAESLYSGLGNGRGSTALDNLANELETLRSHWEATNKNYRLSNAFDFENAASGGKKDDRESLGLSESLADWRKRLDDGPHGDKPGSTK
jgi:chromosome segregation ATPase